MAKDAKEKALTDARRAQAEVEGADTKLQDRREARKASFKRAQEAGLSLREIADGTGLHWTRVREIIGGR
jgi:hypothetical protein